MPTVPRINHAAVNITSRGAKGSDTLLHHVVVTVAAPAGPVDYVHKMGFAAYADAVALANKVAAKGTIKRAHWTRERHVSGKLA